jgi:exonuclease SbcD
MILAHTADWHLSGSGTLYHRNGLNARLMDRYTCAAFCVDDAIKRGAQLILVGGDVFNGWRPTPTEVRLAKRALQPATTAGIPVVIIKGNHDDVRTPTEEHALDLLREMAGLTIVDQPCLLDVWRDAHNAGPFRVVSYSQMLPPGVYRPLRHMQIVCLPFPNANLLLRDEEARKLDPGQRNLLIREHMMNVARGLAADRIPGVPRLLLGHFSVDVAAAGAQDRLMLLGAEFTLNLAELEALEFDGILLGHIHKPQTLGGCTVYSGSPEATGFGEEGEEKRYVLWSEVRPGIFETDSIPTPYRHLVTLEFGLDITEYPDTSQVPGAIVRARVAAGSAWQVSEIPRELQALGAYEVRVEIERAETVRRRETEISASMGPMEALREWLAQKPDLHPLTDALITEAMRVEEALGGGAG